MLNIVDDFIFMMMMPGPCSEPPSSARSGSGSARAAVTPQSCSQRGWHWPPINNLVCYSRYLDTVNIWIQCNVTHFPLLVCLWPRTACCCCRSGWPGARTLPSSPTSNPLERGENTNTGAGTQFQPAILSSRAWKLKGSWRFHNHGESPY